MNIIHKKKSHKGQNGKVLILAGSKAYHGAAVLSGLACLKSGVDLVYPFIPKINRAITASYSPEFIVKTYEEDFFSKKFVDEIVKFSEEMGVILIGPGLGREEQTILAVKELLFKIEKPIILDADGLYSLEKDILLPDNSVLTPHSFELSHIIKHSICNIQHDEYGLQKLSNVFNATVVLKGPVDFIVSGDEYHENKTGNESLTKGGTGDILAGLIAGFVAQGLSGFEAAKKAAYLLGLAGDRIFQEKGYMYRTSELLEKIFD